jgi:hypothetical protein
VPPIGLQGFVQHLAIGLCLAAFMAGFDIFIGRPVLASGQQRNGWSQAQLLGLSGEASVVKRHHLAAGPAARVMQRICKVKPRLQVRQRPFDIITALDGEVEKAGRPIGVNDLHIAAHARSERLTLVTHNRAEFARVPGVWRLQRSRPEPDRAVHRPAGGGSGRAWLERVAQDLI